MIVNFLANKKINPDFNPDFNPTFDPGLSGKPSESSGEEDLQHVGLQRRGILRGGLHQFKKLHPFRD